VFQRSMTRFAETVQAVVAIDGKVLRRSFDPARDKSALHRVSASRWPRSPPMPNPKRSRRFRSDWKCFLKDTIVTVDALNCQRAIAQKIVDQGGDYALALKRNQSTLYDDGVTYFNAPVCTTRWTAPFLTRSLALLPNAIALPFDLDCVLRSGIDSLKVPSASGHTQGRSQAGRRQSLAIGSSGALTGGTIMLTLEAIHWGPASKAKPRQLVVLCHGLGADAFDLIDLAPSWQHACPDALFASVHAPFQHDSGFGRQWWSVADRSPPVMEAGARTAASYLHGFIDAELNRLELPGDAYAIMGFSQGAMIALFTGLRRPVAPRAILAFSGALIAPETLPAELANRAPVLLVHGQADDVVPASRSHEAESVLTASGVTVEAHYIPRLGHGIDDSGISAGALALQRGFS
jgi:phospholipase/carboxylesterase